MKNVKTMYRKLTMMVVLGVLLAVMSCNNLLTPPKGNSTDRDSGSGNVSEDGKVLITIKLFTGSARMVMPDIDIAQLTWSITAEQEQGNVSIPATGTYPTYSLELPTTGNWTFTVKGTESDVELFTGTVTENVSNSTVSISIPLSPGSGMTDGGATGNLDLTIKPEDVLTMTLKYRVDGGDWYTCTTSSGLDPDQGEYWTPYYITESNLSVGQHTLDLYFGGGSKFYFCTVAVNIWPGKTSARWIKTNGEEYINDNGEFVITEEMVNKFVKTMGSVVFVDATVNADEPATGSIFAPVKTVSTAVDILRKANEGNTQINGTIMVSGATTIDQEIEVQTNETLTVKGTGASITNTTGRVFNITGGSLTLEENITLTGTNDTGNGGAVYVNGGNFIMKAGSKITGSRAQNGGGVYIAGGTFTMNGTAILQGNMATTHGGGVHIFSGGTFTMNGGTIGGTAENTANYGGGVFVSGGEFIMNDGYISGNTVTLSGGGVFVNAGNFTMTDGTISGNTATDNGGGVYVKGGEFTMSGGTIGGTEANSANEADLGGGVYVDSGTFTVSGSPTITGNTLNNVYLPADKTITIGADGLTGGTIGVTAESMSTEKTVSITDKTVDRADTIFTSDNPDYSIVKYNGAVYLSDAETVYVADSETFGTFADAVVAVNDSTYGGTITLLKDIDGTNAVFKDASSQSQPITFTGGTEMNPITLDLNGKTINRGLDANMAIPAGSVIKIEGGTLTIKDSSATNSDGTGGTGTITGGNSLNAGGGIHITDKSGGGIHGSLILESGTVSGNFADGSNGGGVYIASDCTFTMKGGSIDGNTVKNSDGGGVFVYGTFTMENGIITNNSSEQGNGGGVNIGSNGAFTMSGGTISGNTATSNGGGVCVSGDGLGFSTFTMSGGTIGGNTATNNGGGVYVGTGNFTLGSSSTESSPVVSGNTKTGSSPNNVYLNDNTLLRIAGKLNKTGESGNIGITMSIPGEEFEFTSGWSDSGLPDSTFFFSDDTQYKVEVNDNGELQLINK